MYRKIAAIISRRMIALVAITLLGTGVAQAQNQAAPAGAGAGAIAAPGAGAPASTGAPAGADAGATCVAGAPFLTLRPLLNKLGQTLAASGTMILPTNQNARMLFNQPLGASTDNRNYMVYEVAGKHLNEMTGTYREVLSIDQAPKDETSIFKPSDAVSLRVDIPDRTSFWDYHSFVVIGCKAGKLDSWGMVTARISSSTTTAWICGLVGLLAYLLSMTAIIMQRRRASVLAMKYPAVFGAKELGWGALINPVYLTANAFNQASVQKAQVILFSFLVAELVLVMVLNTGTLVNLSESVVVLLGISGVGAAAAQAANTQKTRLSFENWAWLEQRGVLKRPGPSPGPHWRDFVLTNREFDVYKLQNIIFTVAVACALIVGGASRLSDFDIPPALLGVLGLSQVVYIGGVLAKPPTVADLDDALTKLRAAHSLLDTAIAQKTDIDENHNIIKPDTPAPVTEPVEDAAKEGEAADGAKAAAKPAAAVPPKPIAVHAKRYKDDLARTLESMIESALEIEVDPTKL